MITSEEVQAINVDALKNNLQLMIDQYKQIIDQYKKAKSVVAKSKYRTFDEFTDLKLVPSTSENILTFLTNQVWTGCETYPSRIYDPHFVNDQYHIALRKGEFHAQKDQAMAAIYKFFLNRAPDLDIVQQGDDFYVASRSIKDFKHLESFSVVSSDSNTPYSLQENSSQKIFKIDEALGGFIAIDYFFGSDDIHIGNFGFQVKDDILLTYRIDSPDCLDEDQLSQPITLEEIQNLPKVIREHGINFCFMLPEPLCGANELKSDLINMLMKIAKTDFAVIKEILCYFLTVPPIEQTMCFIKLCLNIISADSKTISEKKGISITECEQEQTRFAKEILASLAEEQTFMEVIEKQSNMDYIFDLLARRHRQLRIILGVDKELAFTPRYSDLLQPDEASKMINNVPSSPTKIYTSSCRPLAL